MQTFLSEPTFAGSAAALDNGTYDENGKWIPGRINKQLLEGYQILDAIAKTPEGAGQRINGKIPFASCHPATNMWRGHEAVLIEYLTYVKEECECRNVKAGKNWSNIWGVVKANEHFLDADSEPVWLSDPILHDRIMWTHRANLYHKNPEYYADYKVDHITYSQRLAEDPERVVCCAKGRRVTGAGMQPCLYFWYPHVVEVTW